MEYSPHLTCRCDDEGTSFLYPCLQILQTAVLLGASFLCAVPRKPPSSEKVLSEEHGPAVFISSTANIHVLAQNTDPPPPYSHGGTPHISLLNWFQLKAFQCHYNISATVVP